MFCRGNSWDGFRRAPILLWDGHSHLLGRPESRFWRISPCSRVQNHRRWSIHETRPSQEAAEEGHARIAPEVDLLHPLQCTVPDCPMLDKGSLDNSPPARQFSFLYHDQPQILFENSS